MTLDLDYLKDQYPIKVNDLPYDGKLVVGDTLTVNGLDYWVKGINEDAVVVKELT